MAQQTAVEWLQYLYENRPESDLLEQDFEQAKQMEKEQTERLARNAYNAGYADRDCNHINDVDIYVSETLYTIYEME